eukprot:s384_g5.t1
MAFPCLSSTCTESEAAAPPWRPAIISFPRVTSGSVQFRSEALQYPELFVSSISGGLRQRFEAHCRAIGDVGQPVAFWSSPPRPCFAATDLDVVKLQQRRDQLKSCLRSMKFPRTKTFTVDGKNYLLPLKAIGPPAVEPTQEELKYLAGFFDGDGCVSMTGSTISLSVSQSIDSARVLLRFREAFGGGIRLSGNRHGCCRAVLQWQVYGAASRRAASLMATVACLKQAQLKIASTEVSGLQLGTVRAKLKTLKEPTHIPSQFCGSWPYLAGFFDAEGCIKITRDFGPRLEVWQNNHYILEQLLKFLHQHHLDRWKLHRDDSRGSSRLVCDHRAACLGTLRHLVAHRLSVKVPQADLVLGWEWSCGDKFALREAVSSLNGQQDHNTRLDNAGVLRAQAIHRLQSKMRRTSCPKEIKLLKEMIKKLQLEHAKGKLLCEIRRLKADICRSLSEEGYFDWMSEEESVQLLQSLEVLQGHAQSLQELTKVACAAFHPMVRLGFFVPLALCATALLGRVYALSGEICEAVSAAAVVLTPTSAAIEPEAGAEVILVPKAVGTTRTSDDEDMGVPLADEVVLSQRPQPEIYSLPAASSVVLGEYVSVDPVLISERARQSAQLLAGMGYCDSPRGRLPETGWQWRGYMSWYEVDLHVLQKDAAQDPSVAKWWWESWGDLEPHSLIFAGNLLLDVLGQTFVCCLKGAELMLNEFTAKMSQPGGASPEHSESHLPPPSPPPSPAAVELPEEPAPYVESVFPPPRHEEVIVEPEIPPMEEASEELLLEVRRAKENFMESFKAHLNARCTPEEEAQKEAET